MSEESQIVLNRLKGRIESIISSYESAVFENRELKDKLAASQRELETSKQTIKELTEKLEKVNARKWKFKVGDVLAFEGLTFQVIELLDNNKYLYKVEKFDYCHILKQAGFSVNRDICYFDTHDRVDLIESPSDYSAHLFRLLEEERNKKCF